MKSSMFHWFGKFGRGLGLALVLVMLGGCATGGYGGDYGYPQQGQYPGQSYPDDGRNAQSVTGTVEALDLNSQRVVLLAQTSSYGGGSRVDLYFDQNTRLYYQGQVHAIQGLERGDVVRAEVVQSNGRLFTRTIEVVRNVRDGGGYGGGSQYANELRGSVGYVDPRSQVIELDRGGYGNNQYGGAGSVRVRYDNRTLVEYQGRRYRPEDLERGDMIRVEGRQIQGNEWLATRIWIERSARGR